MTEGAIKVEDEKEEVCNAAFLEQARKIQLLNDFVIGEHLAHIQAYAFDKHAEGDVVMLPSVDGTVGSYKVRKLQSGHNGVVGVIYQPLEEDNTTVHVLIAGTHNLPTVHLDLEPNPGEATFLKCKEYIMSHINQVVEEVALESGKKVNISVAGHSLGGSLAAYITNEILRYTALANPVNPTVLAEQEKALMEYRFNKYKMHSASVDSRNISGFSNLGEITLYAWNPAGISKVTADYSALVGDMLQEKVAIAGRIGYVAHDIVQKTGESMLFAKAKKVDVANLKITNNKEIDFFNRYCLGALKGGNPFILLGGIVECMHSVIFSHTSTHFQEDDILSLENKKIELLSNYSAKEQKQIEQRFHKKLKVLNSIPVQTLMRGIYNVGTFFSWSKKVPLLRAEGNKERIAMGA